MPASDSPFLILWYLFLVFFAAVLVVHVVCRLAAAFLRRRVEALLKAETQRE